MSKVIHNLDPVPTSEERHLLITAEKDTNAMQISGGPSVCRDGFNNHVSSPVLVILFVRLRLSASVLSTMIALFLDDSWSGQASQK